MEKCDDNCGGADINTLDFDSNSDLQYDTAFDEEVSSHELDKLYDICYDDEEMNTENDKLDLDEVVFNDFDIGDNSCEALTEYELIELQKQNKALNLSDISGVKKANRLFWSGKNKTKSKVYRQYIRKQLNFARQICGHFINLFNTLDPELIINFVCKHYSPDFVAHLRCKGVDPLTGEKDIDRKIVGRDKFIYVLMSMFKNVPDALVIIRRIDVLNEGKVVKLMLTAVGTVLASVDFDADASVMYSTKLDMLPESRSYKYHGYAKFYLDRDNKIKAIERFIDHSNEWIM